jgi:hypothetical protein
MISMANTKNVTTNGMIRVNQGQCKKMAASSAIVEAKNKSQYRPVDFFFTSIEIIFAKIGE